MHKNIITAQIKIKLTEKEKTMIKKQAEKQKQDALKEEKNIYNYENKVARYIRSGEHNNQKKTQSSSTQKGSIKDRLPRKQDKDNLKMSLKDEDNGLI